MTVQIFQRVSGDTGPPIIDTLEGVSDLSSVASIIAIIYRNRETTGTAAVTVTSAPLRTINVNLSTWLPTARSGDWKIKYRVLFASTDQWTWESGRADVIRVAKNPLPAGSS